MKKTIVLVILLIISVFTTVACNKETVREDAIRFKEDYESLNGKANASGKEHRSVTIAEKNPFVYVTAEEVVEKIENGETFYVYFGSTLCPWCRSVIEKAIEVANNKNIDTIYYVDIWDSEGNEILRDRYTINEKGKLEKIIDGTEAYYKLLELFDDVLSEYNLTDSKGKSVSTSEKRIYAPNFVYIENGKAVKLAEGISKVQKDAREELTDEMLTEEEDLFNEFFTN